MRVPDVKGFLHKIANYGFRCPEDFEKYEAVALAEQLATASSLKADQKASTYVAIASTLWEKLSCSTRQLKVHYIALLRVFQDIQESDCSSQTMPRPLSSLALLI